MKFPRKQRGVHRQVETTETRMEETRALADILLGVHGQDLTVVLGGSLLVSKVMPERDKDSWVKSTLSPCLWPPSALGKMTDVSLLLSKFTSSREVCGPWVENRDPDPRLASWRDGLAKGGLE